MEQFKRGDLMKISKKLCYFLSITSLLICFIFGSISVMADEVVDDDAYEDIDDTYSEDDEEQTLDPNETYYLGGLFPDSDKETFANSIFDYIQGLSQYSEKKLDYIKQNETATIGGTGFVDTYRKLKAMDLGKYSGLENITVKEISDSEIEVYSEAVYEKETVYLKIDFDYYQDINAQVIQVSLVDKSEMPGASADNQSFGEKMKAAAANTLLGMGTVFAVLIFMSLIISCFKFIPMISKKIQNRKKQQTEEKTIKNTVADTDSALPVKDVTENRLQNQELIAVIAAAIAASEQTSTDSFVVRSIRRR